jgi:hypothetical protein
MGWPNGRNQIVELTIVGSAAMRIVQFMERLTTGILKIIGAELIQSSCK